MCGKYENINYMTVIQDLVYNSILNLRLERGMVGLVKMIRLVRNGKLGQNGRVHLGLNVSSSTHNCGSMINGGNTMVAI